MSESGPNPIAGGVQTGGDRSPASGPVGIGGWLVLPIIGLVITPLRGLFHLASYAELFQSLAVLTVGQRVFLVSEFIGNLIFLLVLPVVLLVLLFRKSASFPWLFVIWAAGGLAFLIIDLAVAQILFGDVLAASNQQLLDSESIPEVIRSLVLAVVWIPYIRMSKRVANTFVH